MDGYNSELPGPDQCARGPTYSSPLPSGQYRRTPMDQLLEFATNHIGLFAAFAAVLLALAANEVHGNLRGAQRLPATDAVRMINDRDALIVDVRTAADFKKGHIINARNLPVNRIEERRQELGKPSDKPLLLYCALGSVAPTVTDKLKAMGYQQVYVLKGGINAWQAAGLPVTTKA